LPITAIYSLGYSLIEGAANYGTSIINVVSSVAQSTPHSVAYPYRYMDQETLAFRVTAGTVLITTATVLGIASYIFSEIQYNDRIDAIEKANETAFTIYINGLISGSAHNETITECLNAADRILSQPYLAFSDDQTEKLAGFALTRARQRCKKATIVASHAYSQAMDSGVDRDDADVTAFNVASRLNPDHPELATFATNQAKKDYENIQQAKRLQKVFELALSWVLVR
jgi:hypothetical protein